MKKLTSCCVIGLAVALSAPVFADSEWSGRIYDVMAKNSKVTTEWCKSHVPDTYKMSEMAKEIKGDNGIMAKNITSSTSDMGGVMAIKGKATFMGKDDDKDWKKTVTYFGYKLTKEGAEKGAWYTDDCKGFYELTPA